ncbi:MAG: DoxX family protein [Acidobacteriia bacterium]|nr:DoxX family protein [Terriglobia bacterium]
MCLEHRRAPDRSITPGTEGWLLGVVLMLAPLPARLKEWAYAAFAIDLASAIIAHLSVGDCPEAWGWAAATGVLWGFSYLFWRRLQATPAST